MLEKKSSLYCNRVFLLLIISLLSDFYQVQGVNTPSFGNIKEQLPHDIVHDIFEDSNGFIWFASKDGLCRYDGYKLFVYRELLDQKSLSSGRIFCLTEDDSENIWVGTERGLNQVDPYTNEITSFLKEEYSLLKDNYINDLYFSQETGLLWIATKTGVALYDVRRRVFRRVDDHLAFNLETRIIGKYSQGEVYIGTHKGMFICDNEGKYKRRLLTLDGRAECVIFSAYRDHNGQMWLGTNLSVLSKIDKISERIIPENTQLSLLGKDVQIVGIAEKDSILWMVSRLNGILLYDTIRKSLVTFGKDYFLHPLEANNPKQVRLTSILKDNHGTIWIGSYYSGVFFHSSYLNQFTHIPMIGKDQRPTGVFGNIIADGQGGIWFGNQYQKLAYLNIDNPTLRLYDTYNDSKSAMVATNPLFKKGNLLWIATDGEGIIVFDLNTKQTVKKYGTTQIDKLPSRRINCGLLDSSGRVWIGFNGTLTGGICRFDDKTETFVSYAPALNTLSVKNVFFIFEKSQNELWLGTRNNGLFSYIIDENKFTPIPIMGREDLSISYIFKDSKERIWIGTFGQGLICMDAYGKIKSLFNNDNSGINNNICGIVEDIDGRIWISSFYEIAYFKEDTDVFINYDTRNNFPIQHVMPFSCLSYPGKSRIYFGGNNGLVEIDPRQLIQGSKEKPRILLTDILINNEQVHYITRLSALKKQSVQLKYNQNNLTFSFAVLDFIYPKKNLCYYFLEGIDNNWHLSGDQREATYNSLPAGKYRLLVKSYRDGIWSDTVALLEINLLPAPWLSWWAFIFYAIFIIFLLVVFFYYQREKMRLEHHLSLKNMELQHSDKMHKFRIDLFTHFSHEIRTPLTLISEPLDDILEQSIVTEKSIKESLTGIRRNVEKIMELINQLMDFRRHEEKKMELNAVCEDVIAFINNILDTFYELSVIQNHPVRFVSSLKELKLWFNPQLMEKVFYNVLMNGFKYASDNSEIDIFAEEVTMTDYLDKYTDNKGFKKAFLVTLYNEGDCLPENKLEKIFEPFYRLNDLHNQHSSGIGLSLNRMIMQLHHGNIWAENKEGKGIAFKLLIPIGNIHLRPEEIAPGKANFQGDIVSIDLKSVTKNEQANEKKFTLLLVEDNNEIRSYLKSKLDSHFVVYDCCNAEDALKILKSKYVSIVVSDIMMKETNGIELCRSIKNDVAFNHIPIILLTANESDDCMKKGFGAGANDYVTKPFRFEILLARIQAQLENYERLRAVFQKQVNPRDFNVEVTDYDQQFLNKCYNYLKENISDPDLSIEKLGKEIGLSRVHLYRKIKYLTNLSPSRFVLNIRLKVAADLLEKEGVTVSDVCWQVGFNNLSYFTKCFKEQFGVLPSVFFKNKS